MRDSFEYAITLVGMAVWALFSLVLIFFYEPIWAGIAFLIFITVVITKTRIVIIDNKKTVAFDCDIDQAMYILLLIPASIVYIPLFMIMFHLTKTVVLTSVVLTWF